MQKSNYTVTVNNNKTGDIAQYSSEFAFFNRHCTISYIVKAKIRSHKCWYLHADCVHAAINTTNEKKGTVYVGWVFFEITHSSHSWGECDNN